MQVCTPLTLDSAHDFDMGKLSAITINANQVCQAKPSVFLFVAKNTARNAIDNNFICEIKQQSQGEITANTHLAWHCHTLHTHPALASHSHQFKYIKSNANAWQSADGNRQLALVHVTHIFIYLHPPPPPPCFPASLYASLTISDKIALIASHNWPNSGLESTERHCDYHVHLLGRQIRAHR